MDESISHHPVECFGPIRCVNWDETRQVLSISPNEHESIKLMEAIRSRGHRWIILGGGISRILENLEERGEIRLIDQAPDPIPPWPGLVLGIRVPRTPASIFALVG